MNQTQLEIPLMTLQMIQEMAKNGFNIEQIMHVMNRSEVEVRICIKAEFSGKVMPAKVIKPRNDVYDFRKH